MKIGEIIPMDREITLNEGKPCVTLMVANTGDRPVQVGSHYHFFEDFIWTFRPEPLSVLSPARKRRCS